MEYSTGLGIGGRCGGAYARRGRTAGGRTARGRAAALAVVACLVTAAPAAAAPRLVYRGQTLSRPQVESLARDALRSPGDTATARTMLAGIVGALQDLGHLNATARAVWAGDQGPTLTVEVNEGPLRRITALDLRVADASDSTAFATSLALAAGAPAAPRAVTAAIARAVADAVAAGHPYATLGITAWEEEADGVRIGIGGARGPRVTVTDVRIDGLRVTRREVAERAMGRLAQLPYNPAAAEGARDKLEGLGLFRRVAFEGLEGEADWQRGRLAYRVEELQYNRFDGVIGTRAAGGAVGRLRVDLDNLLGTGRSAGVQWEARGAGVSLFGARYAEPLFLGAPLRLEGAVAQEVQDTIYVRTRWGARARVAVTGREGIEAGYEAERIVQEDGPVREAAVQSTVFAFDRTGLDDPRAPRRGSVLRVEASQSFKRESLRPTGDRSARASVVNARAAWHRPFGPTTGGVFEARGVGRFSSEDVLPFYDRVPLGGATTLRGHDEEAFRVDRYALARAEWGWFPGGTDGRLFLFWDHAWMTTRLELPAGGTRVDRRNADGYGFGLAIAAAAGRIGVDFGWAPGDGALDGKVHVRLESTF